MRRSSTGASVWVVKPFNQHALKTATATPPLPVCLMGRHYEMLIVEGDIPGEWTDPPDEHEEPARIHRKGGSDVSGIQLSDTIPGESDQGEKCTRGARAHAGPASRVIVSKAASSWMISVPATDDSVRNKSKKQGSTRGNTCGRAKASTRKTRRATTRTAATATRSATPSRGEPEGLGSHREVAGHQRRRPEGMGVPDI